MKIIKWVVALAGLAAFGMAQASNWVQLSGEGNGSKFFVDVNSITYEPNGVVRAWVKADYDPPRFLKDGQAYTNLIMKNRYYCKTRQEATGPSYWYDTTGRVIKSDVRFGQPNDVVPETAGEGWLELLCTQKKM
jgi:hypothetical protein